MGKRGAQSAATQQAKVQKVESAEEAFEKEIAPLVKQLEQAQLNESSIEMLQSVVPFCLKGTKEERHAFQESMLESIESAFKGIQALRQSALTGAEEHLAEVCAKQDQNVTRRTEAESKVEKAEEIHKSKAEAQGSIEADASKASEALRAAQDHEEELAGEKTATLKVNEAFEKFLVTFEALKNGTYPGKEKPLELVMTSSIFQQWRERNKAIDETLKAVEVADAALKSSLPTALRTKPAERGPFSLKAINFCEVALASRGEKLKEKIGGFEQEASVRAQKSQEAQEAFKVIEEKLAAAKAETGTAKAELDVCVKERASIEKEMKAAPAAAQKSQKALEKAQEQLNQTQAVLSKFDELKNRTQPEEAPQEEAAPEAADAEPTAQD